jgi:transposase
MIPLGTGVRVWIAAGHTDMRRGMQSLARQVQEALHRDPHCGDLYVFRGRSGALVKILWHDGEGEQLLGDCRGLLTSAATLGERAQQLRRGGIGMSLYAKRLERGRFVWPQAMATSAC